MCVGIPTRTLRRWSMVAMVVMVTPEAIPVPPMVMMPPTAMVMALPPMPVAMANFGHLAFRETAVYSQRFLQHS